MSGPKGSVTNRDRRRETRRQQYEAARRQRQIEVQRALRRKRIQRGAIYAAAALVVVLLAVLIIHAATGGGSSGGASGGTVIHGTGTYTQPAFGETRDGMQCSSTEQTVQHIHAYLEIYVNGQPYQVPPDTGIVPAANCLYPMHVHEGEANIIHIESPIQATYTLGAFFDIWGQPLSATQMGTYKADASHKLVFEYFDDSGKLHPWTGNPLDLTIKSHETLVVLYNSPNVTPKAYTNWGSL